MSTVFISYAREDLEYARALRQVALACGVSDVFLDIHPKSGISVGDRWRKALRNAGRECKVVLLVLTENWLTSEACQQEFDDAELLDKLIVPVQYESISYGNLRKEIADLHVCDVSSLDKEDVGYEALAQCFGECGALSPSIARRESSNEKGAGWSKSPISRVCGISLGLGVLLIASLIFYLYDLMRVEGGVGSMVCDDSNYEDVQGSGSVTKQQHFDCLTSYLCGVEEGEYRKIAEKRWCEAYRDLEIVNWTREQREGKVKVLDSLPKMKPIKGLPVLSCKDDGQYWRYSCRYRARI